jgi:trehalose 6-phosphate synthase
MLLPLMLRTLIEGSGAQGHASQRELEHVRHGVDGSSHLLHSGALAAPPGSEAAEGAAAAARNVSGQSGAAYSQMQEEDEEMGGPGRGTSDGETSRGAIKIGFFLHTPFPSSEIYR